MSSAVMRTVTAVRRQFQCAHRMRATGIGAHTGKHGPYPPPGVRDITGAIRPL